MSDTCYLNITCRKTDKKRLLELFEEEEEYVEEIDQGDTWVEFAISEANWSLMDERENAALEGIPFYGYHGVGGDYGSYVFASFDKECIDCESSWQGNPTVELNDVGTISDDQLVRVREYLGLKKKAQALIGRPNA